MCVTSDYQLQLLAYRRAHVSFVCLGFFGALLRLYIKESKEIEFIHVAMLCHEMSTASVSRRPHPIVRAVSIGSVLGCVWIDG